MAYIPDKLRQTRIRDGISRAVCEIYEAFCEYANKETGFTFKSIEKIADECEIRHNCARVYLKELFAKGWLIETFGDDGNGNQVKGVTVKTIKTGWKSYSERSGKVDKNFVTPVEVDKKIVNVDKKIVNVDKIFVTPYKESLNHTLNQETNQKEETLSPHGREQIPRTYFGKTSGILAADLQADEAKGVFTRKITDELKTRLGTPCILPEEFRWIASVDFAWLNEFSAERYLQAFDLLEKIRKKKNGKWRVTPEMIEQSIGDTEKLEIELHDLENGANNGNGNSKYPTKRTNAEIVANRRINPANIPEPYCPKS